MTDTLLCSSCGTPGATVNPEAVFWLGRKAAEEEALCENCAESAYMRDQERLMEDGPRDWCGEQIEAARNLK